MYSPKHPFQPESIQSFYEDVREVHTGTAVVCMSHIWFMSGVGEGSLCLVWGEGGSSHWIPAEGGLKYTHVHSYTPLYSTQVLVV